MPEWRAKLEVDVDFANVYEVRREWRVVVRVEPLPRHTPLVVVPHHPAQPLGICCGYIMRLDSRSKLGAVVPKNKTNNGLSRQHSTTPFKDYMLASVIVG